MTPLTTLKVLQASAIKMGQTLNTYCCPGSSPVKALLESGTEKDTVEGNSHQGSARVFQKGCERLHGQVMKLLWSDERKMLLFGHRTRVYLHETAHIPTTIPTVKHSGGKIML